MSRMRWMVLALVAAAGCKGQENAYVAEQRAPGKDQANASAPAAAADPGMIDLEEGRMGKLDLDRAEQLAKTKEQEYERAAAMKLARKSGALGSRDDAKGFGYGTAVAAPEPPAAPEPGTGEEGGAVSGSETTTRAWFPETFLFDPLVVTDDQGQAEVRVRVPDRLTSWRVLALAHSRGGAQGGAVASFLGTLPTYVDLVVPDTLVQGDEVRLPIQLVNTTEAPVATALTIAAENATVTGGGGARTIPAQGSAVEYVRLRADRVGTISLKVALRGGDALVRTIEVEPRGKPVATTRTGTLAAPRTVAIEGPAGADPATDRVRLTVFPGALGLLRAELAVCTARGGAADDAYALLLGGQAPGLLTALGDQADPDALRTLGILATQRAVRHARTLDVETATLFTEAALAHAASPVLQRLGERAAAYLARAQRPDGTFAGGDGWTLQRVLVATADATRAVGTATGTAVGRQRAIGVALAASGAFERNAGMIEDGYTAAAILASGAVEGPQADALRAKVLAAIAAADDGSKHLVVGEGVVRADGARPSRAEATALAVLALTGVPDAPLADLGATLLGSYDPAAGWGDGRANLVAMRAVLELFRAPVPADVKISLTVDGQPVTSGVLDREKLKSVLVLEAPAPAAAGGHTWQVVAEPAVPGLGYSLTLESWVPWDAAAGTDGLELALAPQVAGTVGKPVDVALRAVAPSGVELRIRHALPAGVQVDTPSLDALVEADTIARYEVSAGAVELWIDALDPGQTFAATYRAIPTLAGTLHSPPSEIEAATTRLDVPPSVWTVR